MWYLLKHSLNQGMAKSEGCCGEAVDDCGVDGVPVAVGVAVGEGKDVQLVHVVCAEDDGQPLVIRDVLGEEVTIIPLVTCISAMRILLASW